MEGVVFALRDGLEIMRGLGVPVAQIRATGGGGKHALWRQLQADIYHSPVQTLAAEEGPAYGAALLAAVGAGLYADVAEAVAANVRVVATTAPNAARAARYDELYAAYTALYPALRPSMHALATA
jgi:xylulokinase